MQTPYSQIMDFCKNKNVSELQSKILLHKFYKDYYEVIENYKKKENKEPTKEILEGFESTLLSETTLQGNLKLSEEEIEMALSKEIKKHDRITSVKNFGLSIFNCFYLWLNVFLLNLFLVIYIICIKLNINYLLSLVNSLFHFLLCFIHIINPTFYLILS